jgi:TRAP-type C4-dicarboxylate transport system permease small subunit
MITKIATWLDRGFSLLFLAAMVLARVLLVAMVLLIGANVFMRYVLNSGIVWSEEIALVLSVWFIFIAMPLGVRKDLHISIHLFRNPAPWLDRALSVLKSLATLLLGWVMLRWGWVLVAFTSRSIMPATELPSSLLYLIVPISGVLMLWEALTDLVGFDTNATDRAADAAESAEMEF